ncbi:MAG: tRNA dihydrouridine synthase DusB [Clostridia bacterium]|nr:tRNA dihydrouridine synthase DusB [Clostridia bacterium]
MSALSPLPRLWLAPMAGYSDTAMRALCHRMGAEASVSEMISAKAVVYRDKKTVPLGRITPPEGPVLLQLFGKEPEVMAEAAALLADGYCGSRPAGIDVNMGCPVPKIAGNGEGSALLRDPNLCYRLVAAVRAALPKDLPLSVKLRLGWTREELTVLRVAEAVTAAGAAFLFVHGRTRAEMYAGSADWETIAAVRAAVPVPVIGNGDVTDAPTAVRCLSESGCHGLMIGRGAIGNPFVFREVAAALRGECVPPPTRAERIETALAHLRAAIADKGEAVAVRESRKQIAAYTRGMAGAAAIRGAVNAATTYAEVAALLSPLTEAP